MIRILIIDNHPVVRDGLKRFIEGNSGFSGFAEADGGHQGYQLFVEEKPDVVVLELSLPDLGGLEVARKILLRDPAARIIVFSYHENEMLIRRARDLGVKGFISKRKPTDSVLQVIRSVARGGIFFEDIPKPVNGRLGWGLELLTPREFEVFRHLAEGRTVNTIAKLLNTSPKTVGVHQTRILKKLGVSNAAQLVHLALGGDVIDLKSIQESLIESLENPEPPDDPLDQIAKQ